MQARNHFAVLDGLRGLAAISVLLFHLGHWLGIAGLAANARLAVDLFFCLSGYVLPLAYQRRLDSTMGVPKFFVLRMVRLWPMILAGTMISASYLLVRRFGLHDSAISPVELGKATMLSLVCLPLFGASKALGGPQVFPLNGPQYTLFFELVVNLAWALSPRLRGPRVALAIVIAAFALIGWFGPGGDDGATFWHGFARVFGSFYLGVLVYYVSRAPDHALAGRLRRLASPAVTVAFVLLTAGLFFWPWPAPAMVNLLWSLVASPMLVLGGSRVALPRRANNLALLLGALSYPVYVLHYPLFVWANGIFQKLHGAKSPALEALMIAPLVIAGALIALRLFDEPVRAALTRVLTPAPAEAVSADIKPLQSTRNT